MQLLEFAFVEDGPDLLVALRSLDLLIRTRSAYLYTYLPPSTLGPGPWNLNFTASSNPVLKHAILPLLDQVLAPLVAHRVLHELHERPRACLCGLTINTIATLA